MIRKWKLEKWNKYIHIRYKIERTKERKKERAVLKLNILISKKKKKKKKKYFLKSVLINKCAMLFYNTGEHLFQFSFVFHSLQHNCP